MNFFRKGTIKFSAPSRVDSQPERKKSLMGMKLAGIFTTNYHLLREYS